ncbi:MAG: GNAT family N-acetyltransferase [Magnetococcales bacterium]|nr:GNAT family N-acetyltransferase [Magnetococcales bacterium]
MNLPLSEKEFFLELFRGKTLCLSLISYEGAEAVTAFEACLKELVAADIRLVLLIRENGPKGSHREFSFLTDHDYCWHSSQSQTPPSLPADLWKQKSGIFPILIEADDTATFLERIVTLSVSWRISRMIFIEERGGITDERGNLANFINFKRLSELNHSLEWADQYFHKILLKSIHTLLSHGVGAVGLCRMIDFQRELFTYEGCGTFFSCKHYCEVRGLVWDDFPKVAALIHQGVKENYLLPRSEERISKILLNGFGAFIAIHHLAGICGLFTEGYEQDNAGEVVALYALTRFQGEGIGVRLVQRLKEEGQEKGLAYLFACTQQSKVMDFFQRQGFIAAASSQIPQAKWDGYDPARKDSVRCFVFNLKEP